VTPSFFLAMGRHLQAEYRFLTTFIPFLLYLPLHDDFTKICKNTVLMLWRFFWLPFQK
jgi:hypothetical protein